MKMKRAKTKTKAQRITTIFLAYTQIKLKIAKLYDKCVSKWFHVIFKNLR